MEKTKNNKAYILIMAAVAALFVIIYTLVGGGSSSDEGNGCHMNQTSAFGQGQQAMWLDAPTAVQAATLAGFEFKYPENPSDKYTVVTFKTYSNQIFEVIFSNEAGEKGLQFDKAYTCDGSKIYNVKQTYAMIATKELGRHEVTSYGDGEKISLAVWSEGDYSYGIDATGCPLSEDEIAALIAQME